MIEKLRAHLKRPPLQRLRGCCFGAAWDDHKIGPFRANGLDIELEAVVVSRDLVDLLVRIDHDLQALRTRVLRTPDKLSLNFGAGFRLQGSTLQQDPAVGIQAPELDAGLPGMAVADIDRVDSNALVQPHTRYHRIEVERLDHERQIYARRGGQLQVQGVVASVGVFRLLQRIEHQFKGVLTRPRDIETQRVGNAAVGGHIDAGFCERLS
ncbi:MAG: hypothetical protein ABS96_28860 [Lysobacteraceae bacterium SCN 69-123]|nr:MAG: hypothetical protein ABS96_28860 [Xanthomonadaceae bacterium SCN 69-123]